jgi:hypothetical protein
MADRRAVEAALPRHAPREPKSSASEVVLLITAACALTLGVLLLSRFALGVFASIAILLFERWRDGSSLMFGSVRALPILAHKWGLELRDERAFGTLADVEVALDAEGDNIFASVRLGLDLDLRRSLETDEGFDPRRRFHNGLVVEGRDAALVGAWTPEALQQVLVDTWHGLQVERGVLGLSRETSSVEDAERLVLAPVFWVADDLRRFAADRVSAYRRVVEVEAGSPSLAARLALGLDLRGVGRRAGWSDPTVSMVALWQSGHHEEALKRALAPGTSSGWAAWIAQQALRDEGLCVPRQRLIATRGGPRSVVGLLQEPLVCAEALEVLAGRAETLQPRLLEGDRFAGVRTSDDGELALVRIAAQLGGDALAARLAKVRDPRVRAAVVRAVASSSSSHEGRLSLRRTVAAYRADPEGAGALSLSDQDTRGRISEGRRGDGGITRS